MLLFFMRKIFVDLLVLILRFIKKEKYGKKKKIPDSQVEIRQ